MMYYTGLLLIGVASILVVSIVFLGEVWLLDRLVESVQGEYPDGYKFPLIVTATFLIVAMLVGYFVMQLLLRLAVG